ncbi:MAG TPA: CHAT domain-containing tetratricopeptide repeat protein [Gemmataceae bacterium]|nr:CHAT domain-containing tetratricopeptide repeat protein [Gemmataceae bacterium]
MRTRALLLLICCMGSAFAQEPKPGLTEEQQQKLQAALRAFNQLTPEERRLFTRAAALTLNGRQLLETGHAADAVTKFQQALAIHKELYPASKHPDGHTNLIAAHADLGRALCDAGRPEKAVPHFEEALAICRKQYPESKYAQGHPDVAACLSNLGLALDWSGRFQKALANYEDALAMERMLYPEARYPDGHPALATSLNNLACALNKIGKRASALAYHEQALAMRQRVYPVAKFPDGHPDISQSLNNLGLLLEATGHAEKGLVCLEQALAMDRTLYPLSKYPDGHRHLAISLENLGQVAGLLGQWEKALAYREESLALNRKLYPKSKYPHGHPSLANSLNSLATVLTAMGNQEKALPYFEESLSMRRELMSGPDYPLGHRDLVNSLENTGMLLLAMGQAEKALPLCEQALTMSRKLYPPSEYPDGDPELAGSLSILGDVVRAVQQPQQALSYYREASAMLGKLYPPSRFPDGHRDLAINLNAIASVLADLDRLEEALDFYRQALAMRRKLYPQAIYPDGHNQLLSGLNNVGVVLETMDRDEEALPYLRAAAAMAQKLFPASRFPNGHPSVAMSSDNLAFILMKMGRPQDALIPSETALVNLQTLLRRELAMASEAAAFDLVEHQKASMHDIYMSITRSSPHSAQETYEYVWRSRNLVSRVLEQRHATAQAAGTSASKKLVEVRANHRRFEQLLQDGAMDREERSKLLRMYEAQNEKLERALAAEIPQLGRWQQRDALGPRDLAAVLPGNSIFIDIIHYQHSQFAMGVNGRIVKKQVPSYAVFAVRTASAGPGASATVQRIELGEAKAIDDAITEWRTAIAGRKSSTAPGRLQQLVWDPIAAHLPAATKTLYIAADADLGRLPWAALPIAPGKVLLENCAVATVPHGAFLLEQLKWPPQYEGPERVLAVGRLAYKSDKWPDLPATGAELNSLVACAPAPPATLTADEAKSVRVLDELGKVRLAHFATHGFFDATTFTAEKKREDEAMKKRQFGEEKFRVVKKNPLGFVGLVLSNGELLTGLSLLEQPLANLKLVTLSACETGLGEYTGAKGVENLQMAFHLAGCPNVIASLWNVNDAATAALMAKFYHELWVNQKPPIEALRAAQLTIYYRPELIPDLAGERGAPKLKEAVAVKHEPGAPAAASKRADTKLWAAFVLSGVGK